MKMKADIVRAAKRITPLLLIIILIFSFFSNCRWFYCTSTDFFTKNQYAYIEEITAREALTFKTKLEDQLLMLESLSKQFLNIDFTDYNAIKNAICTTSGIGDFKRITFATLTGSTISNDNTTSGNILKKDYFQEALRGTPTISSTIETDTDGEEVLVLAVPIEKNEEVAAVLTGTFNRSILNQLFPSDAFDNAGYSYVTDSEGNALVLPRKTDTGHLVFNDNFFNFLELADLSGNILVDDVIGDFALGNTNLIQYEIGQESYVAFYTPIEVHSWYSLTILNTDFIHENISPLNKYAQQFIFQLILLFLILVIWLVFYKSKLRKVRLLEQELRQKEKNLESVSAKQHLVLFNYDYSDQSITLSGDLPYILGSSDETYTITTEDFLKHLHPQDAAVSEHFRTHFSSPDSSFNCEFRFQCQDAAYHWFHIQTSLIAPTKETPARLLGNMINVDASNKNPLIFSENQNILTGFFTKEYFEETVNVVLRNSDPSNVYALYLIGPDRFSELNDIMGHETGDQILLQIAQRISAVFSPEDIFGHIAGDTFAVFLHIHPEAQKYATTLINEKAEKLTRLLTETFHSNKGSYKLTVSTGIALFAKDGANCKTLMNQAYTALNYMKKNNKGHFGIYSIEMEEF